MNEPSALADADEWITYIEYICDDMAREFADVNPDDVFHDTAQPLMLQIEDAEVRREVSRRLGVEELRL